MTDDQRKWIYWAIPIVVVVGLGAALYYGRMQRQAEPEAVVQAPIAPAAEEPGIQHPIEEQAVREEPLPPLSESDAVMQESLSEVLGRKFEQYLAPKDIVRNVVVTVDNLPRKKTAVQRWPLKPVEGELVTEGEDDITLSEANFERYQPLVSLVQNTSAQQVSTLYQRFYPLFQQAYVDLGYPDGYFNDRLVEVIDHLLATPDVRGPIRLTRPSVYYEFADPSLEERSAGQKLLIRMGPENAAAIKAKLRELRTAVTDARAAGG
jgi:Protein of unknown function (DUF3014)